MSQTQKLALILDGRIASDQLLKKIKDQVDLLLVNSQRAPGLCVIQVGENPASSAYIRQKKKAAEQCGFYFVHRSLQKKSTFSQIKHEIESAAQDPLLDGIILQLPLDTDPLIDAEKSAELLECIPPSKDADGLHSFNQGKLFTGESTPDHWTHPIPATPLGIYRLLEHYQIDVAKKYIVVVGKSRLVGLPTSVIMAHKSATVSICNRATRDLGAFTKKADIIIVAAGRKHLITTEHIEGKPVVVDVGIHVDEHRKLTGDVDPKIYSQLSAYSPVPGGVGPMTVASLIENTLRLRLNHKS